MPVERPYRTNRANPCKPHPQGRRCVDGGPRAISSICPIDSIHRHWPSQLDLSTPGVIRGTLPGELTLQPSSGDASCLTMWEEHDAQASVSRFHPDRLRHACHGRHPHRSGHDHRRRAARRRPVEQAPAGVGLPRRTVRGEVRGQWPVHLPDRLSSRVLHREPSGGERAASGGCRVLRAARSGRSRHRAAIRSNRPRPARTGRPSRPAGRARQGRRTRTQGRSGAGGASRAARRARPGRSAGSRRTSGTTRECGSTSCS